MGAASKNSADLEADAALLASPVSLLLLTAASLWCFVGLRPLMGSLRMDWNTTYHFVIANETDGSRPWLGEICYIGIYDRALESQEVSFAYLSGNSIKRLGSARWI